MTGYERYRTRKGYILEHPDALQYGSLFEVWLKRDDGTFLLVETTQRLDLAICVLKDAPPLTPRS